MFKRKVECQGEFLHIKIHILWCNGIKVKANTPLSYGSISISTVFNFFFFSSKNMVENSLKLEDGDTK